jgi:NAD(P)-dependent dehydrogenase (short-subunit alcohol dehydrogenase family)
MTAIPAAGRLFDLSGRVALVTGGSRGIGLAIARRLAEQGAAVAISARGADACEAAAAELRAAGARALAAPCDLSAIEALPALVKHVTDGLGPIDILVANAGAVTHVGPMKRIASEAFDAMFAANVKSYVWLANLVLPGMAERRDGAIVLIGSISGLVGERALGIYGMTKAAEMQLVRNIAVEYGRHNVRANAIAPGLVRTDMTRPLWSDPKTLERIQASYPLGRIAEPDDIAGVALFLAAPASRFVTGQTIVVDGGGLVGAGTPI